MRFWDASAIVPLLIEEESSVAMRAAADEAPLTVWWATRVECASAIARRERAEREGTGAAATAFGILESAAARWREIPPTDQIRVDAERLVRVHDLRAADAFQLAAARIAADGSPGTLPFVTLDGRLALAARREGFPVLGS